MKSNNRLPYGFMDQFECLIQDLADQGYNVSYIVSQINKSSNWEVKYVTVIKFMKRKGIKAKSQKQE